MNKLIYAVFQLYNGPGTIRLGLKVTNPAALEFLDALRSCQFPAKYR